MASLRRCPRLARSPELATAYTDTLGDLALGLTGSTLTATIAVIVMRQRSPRPSFA